MSLWLRDLFQYPISFYSITIKMDIERYTSAALFFPLTDM